ncbi:hypothetical protein SAMN05216199_3651 [Pedococcus cremeus]|uniref:Glycosyltransferase RgtA/B/C/D-like domain-containing protein n=1 Tax=Pedococcus cremeus TaxID=587636 RepID=A0A1H9XC84_9MICO|nr:hypothetical protein [Pedococcus cremeus]SES43732.1 hypothetical protein SAMN05216199_3651 [Pedococcus cremeus]
MSPGSPSTLVRRGHLWGHIVPLALLAALPVLALRPVSDPSPWLHLKVGQFLLHGNRFGLPDPWAPFASHEYIPTQWLPSILSAVLFDRFGSAAVVWERAAGIAILALLLWRWASSLTRPWVACLTTTVAIFAAWPSLTERPQLAGFVLLAPVLMAWWRTAEDRRPRWWLVPLTWVAASTHGVWVIGLGLGGLTVVTLLMTGAVKRRAAVRLLALKASCLLAAALTPLGPRLLLTPFAVGSQAREFVQEWMPTSVRSPHVMAVLLLLAAAWLAWLSLQRRPPTWQLVNCLVALVLTLYMERTVAVAAMVALPLTCTALEQRLPRRKVEHSKPNLRLGWVAVLFGLVVAVPVAGAQAGHPRGTPYALQPALAALPTGTRILVDSDTSGWVMFAAPQLRPVYDLRVESYTSLRVRNYMTMVAAEPGWEGLLSSSGATAALVKEDAPVRAALAGEAGWSDLGSGSGLVLMRRLP